MNKRFTVENEQTFDAATDVVSVTEPEYRVNVLLPELKQYPPHVVNAVLAQHGLTAMSLITKSRLVEYIEAWLKGAANV